jgi:hypothetical protein
MARNAGVDLVGEIQKVVHQMSPAELFEFKRQLSGGLPEFIQQTAEQARAAVANRQGKRQPASVSVETGKDGQG